MEIIFLGFISFMVGLNFVVINRNHEELKMLRKNTSILQEQDNRVIAVLKATNEIMNAIESHFQREHGGSITTNEFVDEVKRVLNENLNGLRSEMQSLRPPRRIEKQQKKQE